MAEYNLGTARGVIELEYKGDGARKARDDLKDTGDQASRSSESMRKSGKAAGIAGLAIGAGFAIAAKTAADFEERMSAVEAVAGASGAQMDKLREKALQLGKDTAFSAGESAKAMEELAKAGIPVEDILNGAADAAVALAAAGGVDMATAASIASAAMNSFNLKAKEATKVADLMAGAANKSATDVTGIGEAFKYVAPMAASTGVTIEDTTTAIAALAKAGITGSQAGTTLRGMFQRLNPASKEAKKTMKELGIITKEQGNRFFDAKGNTKSMAEISGVLADTLGGLSDKQKSQALTTIFGARAMTGAIALAKEGEKGFGKLGEEIGDVSAQEVAATKMDNLKGRLEELTGSLETLGITVGTILLPFLTDVTEALTSLLNVFLELSPGAQTFIVAVIGILGVMLLITAAVIKYVLMLSKLRIALAGTRLAFIATWLAALGPIALVIAAVAAIGLALFILWKKSETFRDIVMAVWEAIKSAALAVASWFAGPFVNFFVAVWNAIKAGLSAIGAFFVAIWNGIKAALSAVFAAIAMVVRTYIQIWVTIIRTVLGVLMAFWRAFWNTFGGIIKAVFGLIKAIVRLGWTVIKGLFILFLRGILAVVRSVWNAISSVIGKAWSIIKAVVGRGIAIVKTVISAGLNAVRAVFSAVWNAIAGVIRAVWGVIGGTVMAAVARVRSAISSAWNTVKSLTTSAWNAVKNAVSDAVNGLMDIVNGIKDKVLGALSGAASWLYDAGRDIIQGLLDGIESMIGAVTDKINSVTDKISGFLPGSPVKEGPLKVLNRGYAGRQIVEMIAGGIGDAQRPLEQTLNNVMTMSLPSIERDLQRAYAAQAHSAATPGAGRETGMTGALRRLAEAQAASVGGAGGGGALVDHLELSVGDRSEVGPVWEDLMFRFRQIQRGGVYRDDD